MLAVMLGITTPTTVDYNPPMEESVAVAPTTVSIDVPEYGTVCVPDVAYICNDRECKPTTPTSGLRTVLDDENSMIHRCDDKGCDAYIVDKRTGGMYVTYQRNVGWYLLKTDNPDRLDSPKMWYTEIATMGLNSYIYRWHCGFYGPF